VVVVGIGHKYRVLALQHDRPPTTRHGLHLVPLGDSRKSSQYHLSTLSAHLSFPSTLTCRVMAHFWVLLQATMPSIIPATHHL
jgi:hypothetical protein